jgi:hypothetical protein
MDESTTGLLQYSSEVENRRSSRSVSTDSTRTHLEHLLKERLQETLRRIPWWKIYLVVTALVLLGMIGWVVLVFHHPTELINSASVPWKHCGNSPVEALQNDCVYDFIAGAFVPNACFDAELEDEFLKLKDWHFYGDENAQQELSIESIKLNGGTEPMFVSVEYHWIHCTYTWRKLHRSRVFGTPIDDHIGNYSHTAHCGEGLVSQCDVNDTRPIIAFLHHYTSCLA